MHRSCRQVLVLQMVATLLCLLPENRTCAQQEGVAVEESGYGNSGHSLVLLRKKGMQDELKLAHDQRAKLEEIAGTRQTITDPTERRKKNVELGKAAEKVLSSAQLKRFKEISLQAHGLSAMTDSIVVETLRITGDQLKRLQTVRTKFAEDMKTLSVRDEKQFFELQSEAMNEVMALLTPVQREKYEEMKGKPIDVERLLTNKAQ
jgi:Spy/CpxP family protein refolding chaperone